MPEEPSYNIINRDENYEIPDICDLTPIDTEDELSIDYEMLDITYIKPIDEDWYLYKEVEQKGRKR